MSLPTTFESTSVRICESPVGDRLGEEGEVAEELLESFDQPLALGSAEPARVVLCSPDRIEASLADRKLPGGPGEQDPRKTNAKPGGFREAGVD